jgi:RNA polymerase sigma factor (sigma-70 family)
MEDVKSQTLELLQRYAATQAPERRNQLRNRIIQLNVPLAKKAANRYSTKCSEPFEDLLQEGVLGLNRAVERFDLSRGVAFSSFAMPYIRGSIQHYLRDRADAIRIPRAWVDKRSKVERLKSEGVTPQAIATELRFKGVAELEQCEQALRRSPIKSLDTESNSQALRDRLPALEWQGSAIELLSIEGILMDSGFEVGADGYFDAGSICKQEGKLLTEFRRLPSTRKRLAELENMGESQVFKISRGRNGKSFLHKAIAPEFLIWVNPTRYRPVVMSALVGNLNSLYGSGSQTI